MFFQTFVVSFIHANSSFFFTLTGDYGASDSESSLGFQTFTVPIVRLHFLCHLHCCTGTRSFTFCFMYLILVKSGISVDILNLVICMFQNYLYFEMDNTLVYILKNYHSKSFNTETELSSCFLDDTARYI